MTVICSRPTGSLFDALAQVERIKLAVGPHVPCYTAEMAVTGTHIKPALRLNVSLKHSSTHPIGFR